MFHFFVFALTPSYGCFHMFIYVPISVEKNKYVCTYVRKRTETQRNRHNEFSNVCNDGKIIIYMLMAVQFIHTNDNNCKSDRTIIINFC